MVLRIQTNVESLTAQRHLFTSQNSVSETLERLSTGLRINRSADDAAGLAISEKMRSQIRGLFQSRANTQDSINLIQTAEGGAVQVFERLQRIRELTIQSANDSNTQSDREKIQLEINATIEEINRLSATTEFNTKKLLDGSVSGGQAFNQDSFAEVVKNIRVGNNSAALPIIRDFVDQVQAMATLVTMDSAISMLLVANEQGGVGMEVRSSIFGLLTTVANVSTLPSSSFGISLDSITGTASLLTLDLNKGGLVSGIIDRATPLTNLIAVERFENFAAGNFDITVGGTPYSIAVDPNTTTINSLIASINGLSNATHTFTATFNDVTSLFDIQVTNTAPVDRGTTSVTVNYNSSVPAAFGPGAGAIAPDFPTFVGAMPPVTPFNYAGPTAEFPDLDNPANDLDTTFTTVDAGASLVALLGGLGGAAAGQNRLITGITAPTFEGTVVANAAPSEFTLTTIASYTNVTSSDRNDSTNVIANVGATWLANGFAIGTGAGNDITLSGQRTDGSAFNVTVAVDETDLVTTTATDIQNALNAIALGGEAFTVTVANGATMQINHTITKDISAGGSNTVQVVDPNFVVADAPIPFGGTTGPNNLVQAGVPAPTGLTGAGSVGYANPGIIGPGIDLTMNFSGTSGIENSLFLTNVGDTGDAITRNLRGVVTNTGHDTYDLTTFVDNEFHNDVNNSTSTQPVGSLFQVSPDDIGQEVIIQIHAQRREAITDNALSMHIGANEGQSIRIGIDELSANSLNIEELSILGTNDIDSHLQSQNALGIIDTALERVSTMRSRLGAIQNRLENTLSNLSISQESLMASESQIRDTDFASETAKLTRAQILIQAGTAILAQANANPQNALSLLF